MIALGPNSGIDIVVAGFTMLTMLPAVVLMLLIRDRLR